MAKKPLQNDPSAADTPPEAKVTSIADQVAKRAARRRKGAKTAKATETAEGFKSLPLTRRQLRAAFSDSDLQTKAILRAMSEAETPEEALVAMAEKAAQHGEKKALSKVAPPTVSPARVKLRHLATLLSFVLVVLGPIGLSAWYLWARAAPQYASTTAFSVRQEDHSSPAEALGASIGILNTSTSDTDVLYDFLTSQDLVAKINGYRDLGQIWSRPGVDLDKGDPVFAYHPGGTIEDLTSYWERMVHVAYDTGAMILEVRVQAFTPEEAQMLAQDILNESTDTINALSSVARRDVLRYAEEDLAEAEAALKAARQALTEFRNRYQIASIETDIGLATGPLKALTDQLVEAKIERGLLLGEVALGDPRLTQIDARIAVIEDQIQAERAKFGATQLDQTDGAVLASRIAEFDRLTVDQRFAEQTYQAALTAYYAARAEANRPTLYLAAHKNPSLAERADYPDKVLILAVVGGLSFAVWALSALTLLSLRDRR